MKIYYYLLYRIYSFYVDKKNEKSTVLFSVTAVSTLIIYFLFFNIYLFLDYLDIVRMFSNKYYVVFYMFLLGLFNYYFFIKQKIFLGYNFKKDYKGGLLIILFALLLIVLFILIANLNRTKIFNQFS